MDALTDLKNAVSKLGTDLQAEIAAVKDAITASQNANAGAVSATDAEGIVTQLTALDATVAAETAALAPPAPATPAAA